MKKKLLVLIPALLLTVGTLGACQNGGKKDTGTDTGTDTTTDTTTDTGSEIEVTSVTLDKTSLELGVEESYTLKATVAPENATDTTVSWSSSDDTVASVSKNGKVTGLKVGTATITAKSSNNKTATCTVSVVKLTMSDMAYPSGADTTNMVADTNSAALVGLNAAIFDVQGIKNSADNNVGLNRAGQMRLYNNYKEENGPVGDGNAISVSSQNAKISKIKVIKNSATDNSGKKLATLEDAEVKSGNAVVTGDADGVYLLNGASDFTIKNVCTLTESCQLWLDCITIYYTYEEVAATGISLDKESATVVEGGTVQLTATLAPENCTELATWSSADEKIAKVSQNGVVEGVKAGKTTITASVGEFKAECEITVEENQLKTLAEVYAVAAALGKGESTEDAYLFRGTIIGFSGNSFVIQDGEYGLYIYSSKAVENAAVGKLVEISATLKNYNGQLETGTLKSATVVGDGTLPTAVEVKTLEQLAALKQSVLCNLTVKVTKAETGWASNATKNFKCQLINGSEEAGQITLSFNKYSYNDAANDVLKAAVVGDLLTVTGAFTTAYDSNAGSPVSNQFLIGNNTVLAAVPAN